jgi:NADH-ubiquinone oxidoreductase chain 5
MIISGILANAEIDFKKVVALSTLRQLGLIFIALGLNKKGYCFYHLCTHALFKALLFICVGVIIHSNFGTQEYRSFAVTSNPYIGRAMIISSLSLIGFPILRGFFRKDAIIENLYGASQSYLWVFFFLLGILLTCRYSLKIFFYSVLTFKSVLAAGIRRTPLSRITLVPIFILSLGAIRRGYFLSGLNLAAPVLVVFDKCLPLIYLLLGFCVSRLFFVRVFASGIFGCVTRARSLATPINLDSHDLC